MKPTDRTRFIQHISNCLGRNAVLGPPSPMALPNNVQQAYLQGASVDTLKSTFIANARAAGTNVFESSPSGLNETIVEAVSALANGTILLTDDPLWQEQDTAAFLAKTFGDVKIWDTNAGRKENIETAEAAAVGIAVARMALAETGTVMVFSHRGCGRSVTLLPTTTLMIVQQNDICARLTQSMADLEQQAEKGLPSSVNFISGASSTSDIELVRVQGVHGPVKIAYIVVS